ncbi:MAG: hypothetical protein QME13_08720, partial [Thermoanaerobacteraceae bacterium]|nr:hypothetical protein [Thermoanaerobacteraceae bacterium]
MMGVLFAHFGEGGIKGEIRFWDRGLISFFQRHKKILNSVVRREDFATPLVEVYHRRWRLFIH